MREAGESAAPLWGSRAWLDMCSLILGKFRIQAPSAFRRGQNLFPNCSSKMTSTMHPKFHWWFDGFLMACWLPKSLNLASKMHPKSTQNPFKISLHFLLIFGFILGGIFKHFELIFQWFFGSWLKRPDPTKVSPLPIKSRVRAPPEAYKIH